MRVWRVVQARHEEQALTGEGARRYGGRWNPVGVPMVYAAQSCALAVLEIRVHLLAPPPHPYVALEVDVPDEYVAKPLEPGSLPPDWSQSPATRATREMGRLMTLGLLAFGWPVPSAVLPLELVVLLNPRHRHFADAVRVVDRHPVEFDRRLF